MKTYRCKGTITVFLSLISVLFLSLLCTTVESARIQGARAKAAAALDMGLFSVFGEFENSVLEQYDVFFLDGACGTGSYSQKTLEEKNGEIYHLIDNKNPRRLIRALEQIDEGKDRKKTGKDRTNKVKGEKTYRVGGERNSSPPTSVSAYLQQISDKSNNEA